MGEDNEIEIKESNPGYKTTEFWLASVTNVAIAIIGILIGYGLLTSEQGDLWVALVVAVVPLALAAISVGYSNSRAKAKAGW